MFNLEFLRISCPQAEAGSLFLPTKKVKNKLSFVVTMSRQQEHRGTGDMQLLQIQYSTSHLEKITQECGYPALQKEYTNYKEIVDIVHHDIRNKASALALATNPKRLARLSEEKRDETFKFAHNNAAVIDQMTKLLELKSLSIEEFQKYSKIIDIVDISKIYARSFEAPLSRIPLSIYVKSNPGNFPEIYANEPVIGMIFGNLIGGQANHSPPYTSATTVIYKQKDRVRVMGENLHIENERRPIAGKAMGLGFPMIRKVVGEYGGTINFYDSPRISDMPSFEESAKFGYKGELTDYPNTKIFGVDISIPIANLENPNSDKSNKNHEVLIDSCYLGS